VAVLLVAKMGASNAMKRHVLTARAASVLRVVVRMAFVDLEKIVMRAVHVLTDAVRKDMLEGTVALEGTI
tara:strand:+ start:1068 stop:1277 length:210 start_codon:yes stop_codon:yes gene_type:complete